MKTINTKPNFRFLILIFIFSPFYLGMANNENFCSEYIRIWGLVKYYSPYRTNPIPNLDSVFQQDIKNILNRNNKKVFNNAIKNLLEYSSKYISSTDTHDYTFTNTTQIDSVNRWIFKDKNISNINRNFLILLTHKRRDLGNPFVKNDPDNYSAVFTNEKRFLSPFPSVEIRLLALARYWNAINYFFPHKSLLKVDWNTVLDTFKNELIACKDESEFHLIILRLASLLGDGHGSVHSYQIEKHYGFYQLPCEVSYINNQLFITEIFKTAINNPFKFGDIIIEINYQSFEEYYLKDSCYIWGSNTKRKKNICANNFLKSQERKNNTVRLLRNDSIIEVLSPSIEISSLNDTELLNYKPNQGYLIGDNYIYLNLSKIDSSDFEKMVLSSNKSNIIIDLRDYPNWVLNQIADLFAPNNLPFAAYQFPDISSPGQFSPPQLLFLKPNRKINKANYEHIILMVNYTTISRGEFLCMAFQSLPNVLTFGDETAGADGNISKILLPGNISTQLTGLGILYPDGQQTQQTGVKIDIHFVKKGIGISSGQDEELNYIINSIIKKGK